MEFHRDQILICFIFALLKICSSGANGNQTSIASSVQHAETCHLNFDGVSILCEDVGSCRRHCGEIINGHSGFRRVCQCDRFCHVYGDCCHDYEQHCADASKQEMSNLPLSLGREDVVCYDDKGPVVTTCRQKHVTSKSFRFLVPLVQSIPEGINFINEDVMKCHVGESGQWEQWFQYVHVDRQMNPSEVGELIQELILGNHSTSKIINKPRSFGSRRGCSLRVAPSTECFSTTNHADRDSRCVDMSLDDIKEHCSYLIKDHRDDSRSRSSSISDDDGNPVSSSASNKCSFESRYSSLATVTHDSPNNLRLIEGKSNENSTTVYVLNWEGALGWKCLECQLNMNNDSGNLEGNNKCHILACQQGFFFSHGDCYRPDLLTLELHHSFTASMDSFDMAIKLIRSCIQHSIIRKDLTLQSLGDRVIREEGVIIYKDHYVIINVKRDDTRKALPMSQKILDDLSMLDAQVVANLKMIQVCFFFNNKETLATHSRCDNISNGNGVTSDVQNYTLDFEYVLNLEHRRQPYDGPSGTCETPTCNVVGGVKTSLRSSKEEPANDPYLKEWDAHGAGRSCFVRSGLVLRIVIILFSMATQRALHVV